MLDDNISPLEYDAAVKRLKPSKAAGHDGVAPGIFKILPVSWAAFILSLLNIIFVSGQYPAQWCFSRLITVFKKGHRSICSNYRGIAVSDCMSNIFESILTKRLSLWYRPCPEQAGAQCGRNCVEHILALRLLIDYAKTSRHKLWILYVDFSKAYDKVPRLRMLEELKRAGCGRRFLLALQAMYSCTKFILKSAIINVSIGVKQGAPMSCILFAFYIDILVKRINEFGNDGFLDGLNALLMMDDTAIVATSREACIAKLSLLMDYCKEYGMEINGTKTKFMVINGDKPDMATIQCRDTSIDYCSCYWYLGSPITDDGKAVTVMREHVKAKQSHVLKFFSFLKRNHNMPFSVKKKVAEACIMSTLLYGTETWLTSNFRQLEVLYNRIIKALLGVRTNVPNDLCYLECNMSSLKDRIIQKRKMFMEHQCKMLTADLPISFALKLIRSVSSPRFRIFMQYSAFQPTDVKAHTLLQVGHKSRYAAYVQLNPTLVQHSIYHSGIRDSLRIQYSRFALSSHNLRSEKGRWTRPVTPRENRLCSCGPYVQDEVHVLTECRLTAGIREQYSLANMNITDIIKIDPIILGLAISGIFNIFN